MNTYYNQLMEYKGADELKAVVNQWEILSDNISKRALDAPIVLPDLFVYTAPGYGNTRLLNLLAEYVMPEAKMFDVNEFYHNVLMKYRPLPFS